MTMCNTDNLTYNVNTRELTANKVYAIRTGELVTVTFTAEQTEKYIREYENMTMKQRKFFGTFPDYINAIIAYNYGKC